MRKNLPASKWLCLLPVILLTGQRPFFAQEQANLEGSWQGVFMENFVLTLDFQKSASGVYSGAILLFQDGNQSQDDSLASIRLEGDSLHFFIPAKTTFFSGRIGPPPQSIHGHFTFPDGTRHLVYLQKAFLPDHYIPGLPPDKEKLKKDLAFLYSAIKDHHPKPYRYISAESFRSLYHQTIAGVEEVENLEQFLLLASHMTDAVGCSHTGPFE